MTFIDTHAHLYGEDYAGDLPAVMQRAREAGAAKVFLPSTDEASMREVVEVAQCYPGFCYPMIGLHPEDLPEDYERILDRMEKELSMEGHPFIGVGEVGLDYYWDASRREDQMRAFHRQTEWALRYRLPLMIHARSAHRDLVDCLAPYRHEPTLKGVFHCFSGTLEEAVELLTFDHFALGIGGIVTFKKSTLPEVLAAVPLNRIVLETDSPYMSPVPYRGKRNETSFLPYTIRKIAEVYGTTPDEVMDTTTATALRIFPLAELTLQGAAK